MTDSLLEFPCEFPIKIMGEDSQQFRELVQAIVGTHVEDPQPQFKSSRDGRYVAVRYTLNLENREQLDALYRQLSTTPECLFVL